MNYRYGILATALAVSLLAIPATAGVTDVSGGQGVEVKTTVRNNYTDTRTNVTNEKNLGTKTNNVGTVDRSSTNYRVDGDLHYWEHAAYQYNSWVPGSYYANGHWYRHDDRHVGYSVTSNNLSNAKSNVLNSMAAYQLQRGSARTGGGNSWSEDAFYKRGTEGNITERTEVLRTRKTTDYTTDYKENKSKMTTTYDGSKLSYTDTVTEPGTILVGDPDAIFNAYTATGKVTINEIRDDYYTRNHVYERDHVVGYTKDVRTVKEGTRTEVWQLNATRKYSPIVLDLDGDGKIEASNGQYLAHNDFSSKVVSFDFFGNGFPVLTEWVGANDGLLCRPNADGSVKGTNLFGIANGFDNGYEEMASLDVDNSGSLEGAELKELRVWTDVNGNGIAEANELKTLDELGITSIKVSHNNYASTFVRNGQTFKSFDWWPNCREMRKVDMASVIK